MEVIRKPLFVALLIVFVNAKPEPSKDNKHVTPKPNTKTTPNICPFTKIFEDIFKIHNKTSDTGIYVENMERAKIFLNTIAKVSETEHNPKKPTEEQLVNHIIDSIKRIEKNMTKTNAEDTKMNQAIILKVPTNNNTNTRNETDVKITDKTVNNTKTEDLGAKNASNVKGLSENRNYVEILTIEPNNTTSQNTTHNMIEALKHLMPMFNSTLTKELHNITIIERHHNKNHSFTATKNVSTIIVTYCDKENLTKFNETVNLEKETDLKPDKDTLLTKDDDFLELDTFDSNDKDLLEKEGTILSNSTVDENKDILEAAQYGIQKMHELYTVLEPKLYSMGLWLDDSNPARYVAAFNAPSDDVGRFSRYGYAAVQAAARFKELTSGGNEDGLQSREDVVFPSAIFLRQSGLLQHCPLRGIPKCPPASKRYRTHDGTCNNFNRPRWGSTMTPVQRFLTPSYSDDVQAPRISVLGTSLPSAREISSTIHESKNVESPGITHLLMQWGQFVDHDITSTSQSRGFNGSVPRCCKNGGRDFIAKELMHPECLPIAVPPSDPFYGPKGVKCLDFVRSSPAPRDDCALGWREQLNQVSGYIDGSPLYASSARQSDKLRLFRNGMLQYGRVQQRRPVLPPERRDELCRGGAVSSECFKSGDARVNEHPGLVAAHIVWLRQHNRMAQELAHLNPHWSDEKIYQETRKIVGAMIQHITYREFLPIVLGTEVMRLFDLEPQKKGFYKGYNPKINPSPASGFGSAAFRFGHSLVQSSMVRFDKFHRPMSNNVSLHNEMTNPNNIWSIGAVDRLMFGMMNQPIQKRDEFISEELTNHLFQTPQFSFGMDLAAINIQRGRDHGLASYTTWREPCGLSTIDSFEDLKRVMPTRTAKKIQSLYKHVDDIDLFTGGMAERPVIGGLVGPTFACIIAQQFSNLRNGDRFWYENGGFESSFTPAQLQQIRRISLAHIICRTLDSIDDIQPFVFLSPNSPDNERISCSNALFNNFDLSPWVEVDSESDNDISKVGEVALDDKRPVSNKRPKPQTSTTVRPRKTTKKSFNEQLVAESNKVTNKVPIPNKTPTKDKNDKITTDKTSTTRATIEIDDKLDFRFFLNKSRRYENEDQSETRRNNYVYDKPTKQYGNNDYDDEDDSDNVQTIQSVMINNLPHKRPYHRPVIAVTENIDKYTYLINYVPRPTQSWRRPTTRRPTTRRPTYSDNDGDVVKVTYQTYDDTYRPQQRPNQPYYNKYDNDNRHDNYNNRHDHDDRYYNYKKRDDNDDSDHRHRSDTDEDTTLTDKQSSARSNDQVTTSKITSDITQTTASNLYKLVTFGYVGTYKGDMTNRPTTIQPHKDSTDELISKDYATYKTNDHILDIDKILDSKTTINKRIDDKLLLEKKTDDIDLDRLTDEIENTNTKPMKLSTFFLYETATKPFSKHRPTRRHDEQTTSDTKPNKYYYDNNVLKKYSLTNDNSTLTKHVEKATTSSTSQIDYPNNYNNHNAMGYENLEERAALDKLAMLEEGDSKSARPDKRKKPTKPAKTPSVNFDVIPSENSPSRWAIFDEDENLPEGLPQNMPKMKEDPYALRELPRPINLALRKHRPARRG